MSQTVDDRVVKMKFDNEQFNEGVSDTLKSLNDLDKNLKDMDKGSYGANLGNALGGIGDAVDSVAERFSAWGIVGMEVIQRITDFAIDKGAEMVKALSVDNIVAGWQKYEDISSNVYALINQVNHGESYEDIQSAIEKLSLYADMTSFDLSTMTNALVSMIAQNMSLEDATSIIMGLGNSFTYAGANAKEASGAFEVYSKAVSATFMARREWQQLTRTYKVAPYLLKQQFLQAGVEAGTLVEIADGAYETLDGLVFTMAEFEDSLSDQKGHWLTTTGEGNVLERVMGAGGWYGKYTAAITDIIQAHKEETGELWTMDEAAAEYEKQLGRTLTEQEEFAKAAAYSGTEAKTLTEAIDAVKDAVSTSWKDIFEAMFGDVLYAKKVWTDFSNYLLDIFASPVSYVANVAKAWAKLSQDMGGRDSFIQIFRNLAAAADSVAKPLRDAWTAIRGPLDFDTVVAKVGSVVKAIEDFTAKLIISENQSNKLRRIWDALMQVGVFFGAALDKIIGLLKAGISVLKPIWTLITDVTAAVADLVTQWFKVFNMEGNMWTWLQKPTMALSKLATKLTDTFSIFSDITTGPIMKASKTIFGNFVNVIDRTSEAADGAKSSLGGLWDKLTSEENLNKFKTNFAEVEKTFVDFTESFIENFKARYTKAGGGLSGVLAGAFGGIKDYFKSLYDSLWIMLDNHFSGVKQRIDEAIGWVTEKANAGYTTVKEIGETIFGGLKNKFGGGGLLGYDARAAKVEEKQLTSYDLIMQQLNKDVKSTQTSGNIIASIFQGLTGLGFTATAIKLTKVLSNLSDMLSSTFKTAQTMMTSIGDSVKKLANVVNPLTETLETMQSRIKADIIKTIAFAVLELAAACVVMSLIDTDKLKASTIAVSGLLLEITAIMGLFTKMNVTGSTMELTKGVNGTGLSKTSTGLTSIALSMMEMGGALLLIAEAVKTLAAIPAGNLEKGTLALAEIMGILAAFSVLTTKKLGKDESITGGLSGNAGMQILKMASGLLVMAQAMEMLAKLDDENHSLTKGLEAIGAILLMVGTFSAAVNNFGGGGISDMGQLIGLAAGLAALALVIQTYANIPTESLITGGTAVAACLTFIGLFMAAMNSQHIDAKQMAGLAGSMILFAASMEVLALSLITFNLVSVASLVEAGVALAAFIGSVALVKHLGLEHTMLAFGVSIAAFGVGIAGLGAGLLALATAFTLIGLQAPIVAAELVEVLRVMLIGFVSLKPQIVAAVVTLVQALCESLLGSLDTILSTLDAMALGIFEHFLDTLSNMIDIFERYWPKFKAALEKIGNAIMEKLRVWVPKVWQWLKDLVTGIGTYLYENYPELLAKLGDFLLRCLKALGTAGLNILDWLLGLLANIFATIGGKALDIFHTGVDFITGFFDGLKSMWEDIIAGIIGFIDNIIDTIKGFFVGENSIFAAGAGLIGSFLDGIFSRDKDVADAGTHTGETYNAAVKGESPRAIEAGSALAGGVEEGTKSIDLTSIGKNAVEGLIQGLKDHDARRRLQQQAKDLGETVNKYTAREMRVESPSKTMMEIGAFAVSGLAAGLQSKPELHMVQAASTSLGILVDETVRDVLGVHSDSDAMIEIGKYCVSGAGAGLRDETERNKLKMEAHGLGTGIIINTIEGLKEAHPELFEELKTTGDIIVDTLSDQVDRINEEVDMNPTITPVMDLSEVDKGIDELNNKLETTVLKTNNGDVTLTARTPEDEFDQWWYEYTHGLKNADMKYLSQNLKDVPMIQLVNGSTMDLVHAAAGGFLSKSDIKKYQKELEQYSGTINYIINQTISSPTPASSATVYRATNNALDKTRNHNDITGSGAATNLYLATSV